MSPALVLAGPASTWEVFVHFLHRVPPEVRQVARLERGERLLGWSAAEPAAASSWGLWLAAVGRLDWDRVDRVGWEPPVLTVTATGGVVHRLRLADPRDLPAVVHAQVLQAVVVSRREPAGPGGPMVRVVARRSPRTGEVWIDVDEGPGGSAAAAAAARLRREVQRDLGL